MWQRQGFESFGDWRRASERARRARAKKTPSACSAASSTTISTGLAKAPATPPRASWQPLQLIQMPSAPNSPLQPSGIGVMLPGKLHEHVQVTPHGSRSHTIEHTSPGGTLRHESYLSPAGAPQLTRAERIQWKLRLAAARRAATAARAEEVMQAEPDVLRAASTHPRCWECVTCLATKRKERSWMPCMAVLSRLDYTESERAVIIDPTQRDKAVRPDWAMCVRSKGSARGRESWGQYLCRTGKTHRRTAGSPTVSPTAV